MTNKKGPQGPPGLRGPPMQDCYITQLKCSRCARQSALMSPNNTIDLMKETEKMGCIFLCDRCYTVFQENVSFAMRHNIMGAWFKHVNKDGSITDKKGFIDK